MQRLLLRCPCRLVIVVAVILASNGRVRPSCDDNPAEAKDVLVAVVMGDEVYLSQLGPKSERIAEWQKALKGSEVSAAIRDARARVLLAILLKNLRDRFASDRLIVVNEKDIKDFIAATEWPEIEARGLDVSVLRRKVAASVILSRNIDEALYREYGGDVVFQRGPNAFQPIGAYRALVESNEKSGRCRILDPSLRAAMQSNLQINDRTLVPPDEVESYFANPSWRKRSGDALTSDARDPIDPFQAANERRRE